MPIKRVRPIFGFGWVGPDGPIDVPDEFDVEIDRSSLGVSDGGMFGRCSTSDHAFSGMFVLITRRLDNHYAALLRNESFSTKELSAIVHERPGGILYTGFLLLD